MTPFEFASLILSSIGLAGGAIGFVVSVFARRRANAAEAAAADAQADASAALVKSAEATERIATAVELIAAQRSGAKAGTLLAEALDDDLDALVLESGVEWIVEERDQPNSFRLRNVGSIEARDVTLSTDPPEHAGLLVSDAEHPTLIPGAAFVVRTSPRSTLAAKRILVTWSDDSSAVPRQSTVRIP
ncbi:hypothetical protein N1027_16050 [Herbiconiux sp. CPCC 205763]|uniref:Uncharacterized protein n=1 Tax=Herbiconiux aconitum TaxID=2970913 RepID=A0ABT2GTW1_9MICO|nr:hypothetical protein [Herbiconiux aconitum]MCS5719645.1 hypothetical protein [Herbiconiux aconitum]